MRALSFEALRRLSHEEFRSGEAIAREFGVSRTTLWSALKEAEAFGVRVFKVHGRGYRLAEPIDWLDRSRVLALLGNEAAAFSLQIVDQIESTNSALIEQASRGVPGGACLVAELQTQGRGRRGRSWYSPLGGGLAFSLLWRFSFGAALLSTLSLAVGVAIVRALHAIGVADVRLKWPNDVVHHYRKLGGILIELQGDVLGPSAAIIGIGLNVRLDEETLSRIGQPVTDLMSVLDEDLDRNRLLAETLRHLARVLQQFEIGGFGDLHQEWLNYHAYHNRPVRLHLPNGTALEGHVSGVAEDGSLILATGRGEQRFTVGEISLRGVK